MIKKKQMNYLFIQKSFIIAMAKVCGYLVFVLLIHLTLNAQNDNRILMNDLSSAARREYKSFLENKEAGNHKLALEHLRNYADLSDSVTKLQRIELLAEINGRYENDKKAHEVNLLKQENKLKDLRIKQNRFLIFGVSGVSLLVWMIIMMMVRQRRFRARQNALALEQTLLRSQMNPHFIFNTLTNIQSFIVRKETALSLQYLDNFSSLIEKILDSSGKKVTPLASEIETISNYFKLQQLRFGNKLNFDIKVNEDLDPLAVMLPPMMIQPLIENAIEHGIKPKAGEGRVEVRFNIEGISLKIEVEDNGVGRQFKKEGEEPGKSQHAGLALVILKERLDALKTGSFEIQDLQDVHGNGYGTISRLILPLMAIHS
jgi:hypothetical protein